PRRPHDGASRRPDRDGSFDGRPGRASARAALRSRSVLRSHALDRRRTRRGAIRRRIRRRDGGRGGTVPVRSATAGGASERPGSAARSLLRGAALRPRRDALARPVGSGPRGGRRVRRREGGPGPRLASGLQRSRLADPRCHGGDVGGRSPLFRGAGRRRPRRPLVSRPPIRRGSPLVPERLGERDVTAHHAVDALLPPGFRAPAAIAGILLVLGFAQAVALTDRAEPYPLTAAMLAILLMGGGAVLAAFIRRNLRGELPDTGPRSVADLLALVAAAVIAAATLGIWSSTGTLFPS